MTDEDNDDMRDDDDVYEYDSILMMTDHYNNDRMVL